MATLERMFETNSVLCSGSAPKRARDCCFWLLNSEQRPDRQSWPNEPLLSAPPPNHRPTQSPDFSNLIEFVRLAFFCCCCCCFCDVVRLRSNTQINHAASILVAPVWLRFTDDKLKRQLHNNHIQVCKRSRRLK
jgi:hypothetical protein